MSDLLILSVFSDNMLADQRYYAQKKDISKEDVIRMAPRGVSTYVKTEAISNSIQQDLGLPVRYLGTKYLQFSPGDTVVVASNTPQGFKYTLVRVLPKKPFNLAEFFMSQTYPLEQRCQRY